MKIALLVNRYSVFLSHRELLYNALNNEFDCVDIFTMENYHRPVYKIQPIVRLSINIWRYDKFILSTPLIVWALCPFAPLIGNRSVILVTGMGSLWDKNIITNLLYKIVLKVWGCCNCKFLVQNSDDMNLISKFSKRTVLFHGSGVLWRKRKVEFNSKGSRKFLIATRIYRDKGVLEFVRAIKLSGLDEQRFYLIGDFDTINPNRYSAIERNEILESKINIVPRMSNKEILSFMKKEIDCCILPSYREGMSKFLLESISMGITTMTTNTPGGRDLISMRFAFPLDLSNLNEFALKLRWFDELDDSILVDNSYKIWKNGKAVFSFPEYYHTLKSLMKL